MGTGYTGQEEEGKEAGDWEQETGDWVHRAGGRGNKNKRNRVETGNGDRVRRLETGKGTWYTRQEEGDKEVGDREQETGIMDRRQGTSRGRQ